MAVKQEMTPVMQKLHQALALQQAGEIEKAQRLYKAVLKKAPDNADAIHLLGVTYRQLGFPRRAFDTIQKAIKLKPNQASFYANLARAMADMDGMATESILMVAEKALEFDPTQKHARNLKAICLGRLDRKLEAEQIFQQLLMEDPDFVDAYRNYGFLLRDNKDFDKALVFFNKAALLDPDNPEPRVERARCRLNLKDYKNSQVELSQALEKFPDNGDLLHEAGRLLFSINEVKKGLAFAEAAVKDNPRDHHRRVTLGVQLLMLGRAKDALEHFRMARKLGPEGHIALDWNISLALLGSGNLPEGWDLHTRRFDDPACQIVRRKFDVPAWNGEDISDKRVLVWADQGLGDALKAGTMLPQLIDRAGSVVVELSDKANKLFAYSFPEVDCRLAAWDTDMMPVHKDFDIHANITDLARMFRRSHDDFKKAPCPVYRFERDRAREYLSRIKGADSKPIIGMSWRSRNLAISRARFYLSAPDFFPIIESEDAIFVNLQYQCVPREIEFFRAKAGDKFVHFDDVDLFDDLLGAAALTACCDFIVSANTSVADMAGIFGIPAIRFGQQEPALLLGKKNPPWYPHMTYMHPYTDRPASEFVPEIIQEMKTQLATLSLDPRMARLGL